MVTPKPSSVPSWATAGGSRVEPLSGQKAAGFAPGTKPPARWVNWFQGSTGDWLAWLNALDVEPHTWPATQTYEDTVTNGAADFNDEVRFNGVPVFLTQQLRRYSAEPQVRINTVPSGRGWLREIYTGTSSKIREYLNPTNGQIERTFNAAWDSVNNRWNVDVNGVTATREILQAEGRQFQSVINPSGNFLEGAWQSDLEIGVNASHSGGVLVVVDGSNGRVIRQGSAKTVATQSARVKWDSGMSIVSGTGASAIAVFSAGSGIFYVDFDVPTNIATRHIQTTADAGFSVKPIDNSVAAAAYGITLSTTRLYFQITDTAGSAVNPTTASGSQRSQASIHVFP